MEKRCVLIGMLGAGKTTLFNLICGKNEKADTDFESNTKIIAQSQSQQGVGFVLLDTPGFGTYGEQVLNHSIGILAALTDGPINRILIVIEYQYRIDVLKKEIDKVFQYVKEYRDIISIIITYKDKCKTPPEDYFNEAQSAIRERYILQSVYFSGIDTTCEELCSFIDQALVEQGKVLKFKDSKFDLMMKDYIDDVLKAGKDQFLNEFNEFYDTVKEYIQQFDQDQEDSDQKLNYLISFVKENAQKIQGNFEKSYAPFMIELEEIKKNPVKAYYYHTVLKYSISEQVQELLNLVNQKMKYPEDHPFRQLRRCPYCGTIWLKVAGCNENTKCGNRTLNFENDFILLNYQQQKYIFQIIDKKVNCIILELDEEAQALNEFKKYQKEVIYVYLLFKQQDLLQKYIDQLNLPQTFGQQFQQIQQLIFAQQKEQDHQKGIEIKYKQFSSKAKSEIQKKIVELNQQIQIKTNKQIGCGLEINWQIAPIVNIDEIDINQEYMINLLSQQDQRYYEEFNFHKQFLIKQAQKNKKNLME